MSAYVTASAPIAAPAAELNTINPGQPFAVVHLSADRHTRAVFYTPHEARKLAAAAERAAVLLDEYAVSRDVAS